MAEYLTTTQFAELIGVHPSTVRSWDKNGLLKPHHYTLTGHRLYTRDQADRILNNGNPSESEGQDQT